MYAGTVDAFERKQFKKVYAKKGKRRNRQIKTLLSISQ